MSQEDIVVELENREVIRKGLAGLRSGGKTPAVIHNKGGESLHVMGESLILAKVYQKAGRHHAVNIKLSGKDYLAMIKKVDFEPKKNNIQHIVFQAIDKNQKVETEVPIILTGEIPAIKAGLLVITNVDSVLVEALPSDLPDQLNADGSKLAEIGDKLHISDLIIPDKVTVLTEPENTIAVVEETKAQISEESAEESANSDGGEESTEGESSEQSADEAKQD